MICIMAGGRAERMGRGVKSVDKTKGLMNIPMLNGGSETIIDRTLRLLMKTKTINSPKDVLLCVGYKANLVMDRYPKCHYLTTYYPDDPTELLPAFMKVIESFPEDNQYIFFLGDVVWSEKAMVDFISHINDDSMVLYHGTDPYYCEIYGISINGEVGKDLIRKTNAISSGPVIKGEIRWQIQGITKIQPKDCRASCMEMWIDMLRLPGKTRVYQKGKVDDVDWDYQHKAICEAILNGEYGE